MKKIALVLIILSAVTAAAAAQELDLAGTWTAYKAVRLGSVTVRDYRNPNYIRDIREGTLTLNGDGTVESTFIDSDSWVLEDGFLMLTGNDGNIFYIPRPITPDMLYLVAVTVTERNREVSQIRVDRTETLLVVRE